MTAPLCINCAHYVRYGDCGRIRSFDPVHGERIHYRQAGNERLGPFLFWGRNRCGPDGQWFVQAEPMEPPKGPPPHRPQR